MSRINSQRKSTCSVFSAGTELKLHSVGEAPPQIPVHWSLREVWGDSEGFSFLP